MCDDYEKGVKGAKPIQKCIDSRGMRTRSTSTCTLDDENTPKNPKRGYECS